MQTPMRWLDVIEAAPDGHLGQTLVRLATLARSAHLHATAASIRKDDVGIHGRVLGSVDHDGGPHDAGAHTEVAR